MTPQDRKNGAVLVVGGGVAGIHASLILAEAGAKVHLIDSAPAVGGLSGLLDKTFPTHSCGLCQMSVQGPSYCPMIEVGLHPGIHIMENTAVKHVAGQVGDFLTTVVTRGELVCKELCDGCGECEKACPVEVDVPAFSGMRPHRAIYRPSHRSIPGALTIDENACTKCGRCVESCPRNAIDLLREPHETTLHVGAIIVSPGMNPCDPRIRPEYGYDPAKGVITGLELERMMSASGPTGGRLVRPSDGSVPRSVAFIQCVGSRDRSLGNPYCSAVCCMYAVKEAMSVKELLPDALVKILYTDIRALGKGFEEYCRKAESLGVVFVPCRVASVDERNGRARLSVETGGAVAAEDFDLVVLSTGFVPAEGLDGLAGAIGIDIGPFGFLGARPWGRSPVETSREGVFACGGAVEPQDIPSAVMWSGACASQALRIVGPGVVGGKPAAAAQVSRPEDDRIGVFVCRCGPSMAQLRLQEIVEDAKGMDNVVAAVEIAELCRPQGIAMLKREAEASKLTKAVVAACSPRDILRALEEELQGCGVPKGLVEVANIREQCAWVHRTPDAAARKARDLVRMAIEQVQYARPVEEQVREIPQGALVVGGGLAGMRAASAIAGLGRRVWLVEKDSRLGGRAQQLLHSLEGVDIQKVLQELEAEVRSDSRIEIHMSSRISRVRREGGGFRARIEGSREEDFLEIECGAVILATGGTETPVPEWLGIPDPSWLITQTELELRLGESSGIPGDVEKVVMVQCAGSRDAQRPMQRSLLFTSFEERDPPEDQTP